VEVLEHRINALEIGKQYDATKEAVRKVEEEYLLKLREIKQAIEREKQQSTSSTSAASSTKELEELRKENDTLKQKNTKLEYRIQHVVSNMEKLYDELKQLKK
jgi:predicted  nucleic acid-binding Zn-ribbon protein